ncbi:fatty acid desaturase [Merismopedia glauca]|uniref:Fatty acid desaturase domain-containing protein n=1 Tax=Merismopedia glauca CCAP 1448/3 TaxID=1296344 RepID=A0A2T1C1E3_9CYAN|nr:fatty acid desaturase [Merismopedia glauca]PSB02096.1 hypothetical protein C7B64_14820 [Merismopedia glauca CCAP 1448/3]
MSDPKTNPRETMRCLPNWMQPFLTMATGKPLSDQIPWQLTPAYHLSTALLTLISGVIGSILILHYESFDPLLIFSWLLTVSGARKLQVTIVHQCAHHNFSGHQKLDRCLGETISVILMIQDFESYQKEHHKDHHALQNLMTAVDPTFKFLQMVGLMERKI